MLVCSSPISHFCCILVLTPMATISHDKKKKPGSYKWLRSCLTLPIRSPIYMEDAFALYLLDHPTCANGHSHKVYDIVQEEAKYLCSYSFIFSAHDLRTMALFVWILITFGFASDFNHLWIRFSGKADSQNQVSHRSTL